ncbi:MAG: hypothetical protein JW850_16345 [Thermoflexales bacterium]|nr:hypothetical protein [Thermoflexales bacterium]
MNPVDAFEQHLSTQEREIVAGLDSPLHIQAFLDGIPYNTDPIYLCPPRVLRERRAHCFDGALFAAAALRRLGHPPLVVELVAVRDDVHMLALYKRWGCWGAVAKSNVVGLRFREPVYRTLRELVMSYFEQYYNLDRERTLRGYRRPVNLKRFDRLNWMSSDEHLETIANRLEDVRCVPVVSAEMIEALSLMDERSYQAGLQGSDEKGLYKPGREK